LARISDRLVVMSRRAGRMLEEIYRVPPEKIAVIPHGIPDMPFVDPHFYKDQFGVERRKVLLTFGLLSPGKGIEVAVRALPRIVQRHPDALYVILGATHPHVFRREGNAYKDSLEQLADELGVAGNVIFHNRFVSLEELCAYIGSADIYIAPYPNRAQITSGTLAYAMGAGKPVVSTPFWHAEEMLAEERGRFFPPGDADKLADQVIDLLDNEVERHAMRKRAYLYTRPMVWKEVGGAYLRLAGQVVAERAKSPRPLLVFKRETAMSSVVPEIDLSHLRRMTDDTGMLQHATYAVPNRDHGYCTDDNARALAASLLYYDLTHDDSIFKPLDTYLSFLHHAFNPATRRFRNFMSYDRKWLEDAGSEDAHGRAISALGLATALAPNDAICSFSVR
jgi:hypothetical protein